MRYRVLQPMSLPKGTLLGLTEAQAAARHFALRPSVDGLWEVLQTVQFKAGETIEVGGEVPKAERWKVEAAPVPALVQRPRGRVQSTAPLLTAEV